MDAGDLKQHQQRDDSEFCPWGEARAGADALAEWTSQLETLGAAPLHLGLEPKWRTARVKVPSMKALNREMRKEHQRRLRPLTSTSSGPPTPCYAGL